MKLTLSFALAVTTSLLSGCAHHAVKKQDHIFYTFRLKPGEDLKKSIDAFAVEKDIQAGSIVTVVGSLTQAAIRYANLDNTTIVKSDLEIVSFTGTVSTNGSHLHLAVSDAKGRTLGGHLMEGSLVRTTAEITIVDFPDKDFIRVQDPASGYKELVVQDQ